MKGLSDEPWIGKIIAGAKVWEMQTTANAVRVRMARVRKGSGTAAGMATSVDPIEPLDAMACRARRHKCGIAASPDNALLRWNHAWVWEGVRPWMGPAPCGHPDGAVIWVNQADAAARGMVTDHGTSCQTGFPRHHRGSTPAGAHRTPRQKMSRQPASISASFMRSGIARHA